MKELAQERVGVRRELYLIERVRHELQPPLTRHGVYCKRHVAHAQTRVPSLLDVTLRAAEASDQKVAEPLLGAGKILGRIHRAQHIVGRHLFVERRDKTRETVVADGGKDVLLVQCLHSSDAMRSRPRRPHKRIGHKGHQDHYVW